MTLLSAIQNNKGKSRKTKPEVSVLIGKAWINEGDTAFRVSPLSEAVEGKKDEYKTSSVYPLVMTDYTRISVGPNKKCIPERKQNTHYVFLNIEEDKLDEYKALCSKIGQDSV